MPQRFGFWPIWCRQVLNWCTLFLYDSSLCTFLRNARARCWPSASAKDHLAVLTWKNGQTRQKAWILCLMCRQQKGRMWVGRSLKHTIPGLKHARQMLHTKASFRRLLVHVSRPNSFLEALLSYPITLVFKFLLINVGSTLTFRPWPRWYMDSDLPRSV